MSQPRPLFVYFRSFHMANIAQILTLNEKSVDGVLGTRTWDGRMVCAVCFLEKISIRVTLVSNDTHFKPRMSEEKIDVLLHYK